MPDMSLNKLKFISICIFSALIFILIVSFFMNGDERVYGKKDWVTYYLITPSVIANVPKVSDDYSFSYTPDDNYGFERYVIFFNNVKDHQRAISLLEDYIMKNNQYLDADSNELIINIDPVDKSQLNVTLFEYSQRKF